MHQGARCAGRKEHRELRTGARLPLFGRWRLKKLGEPMTELWMAPHREQRGRSITGSLDANQSGARCLHPTVAPDHRCATTEKAND
jgi:hypothetical protein